MAPMTAEDATVPVPAQNAAEERVLRFGADFDEQWRKAAPAFEDRASGSMREAFVQWRALIAELVPRHFLDPDPRGLSQSFGNPPEYGPQAETLIGSEVLGDTALVRTRDSSPLQRIHEYLLQAQGEDWRIVAIEDHNGDPAEPFVSPESAEELRAATSPEAPLTELPEGERGLDHVHNFTPREVVRSAEGERETVERSLIGTLVTSTGVLTVLDAGYNNDRARPFARTVRPGYYPVERVTVAGRNAAVRVLFSEEAPASWHPARLPDSGHVFGVDSGSACIVDYPAYAAQTRRDKAAVWRTFGAAERPAAIEVPLPGGDRGIMVDSGTGDGSYPVYWGADAEGRVVQLVVDFMMLVEGDDDGVLRHR